MTSRYRRRDLTVGLRHKDMGLTVHARLSNKRERLDAKRKLSAERQDIELSIQFEHLLDRVLGQLFIEAGICNH